MRGVAVQEQWVDAYLASHSIFADEGPASAGRDRHENFESALAPMPLHYTPGMGKSATGESGRPFPDGPLTIAGTAELAGVSMATVSKVLNGRGEVAPGTRARVEAVLRDHGLQRQRRRQTPLTHMELVFHELEGAYAMEMIRGAERVLADHGMGVAISQLGGQRGKSARWVERILAPGPTGVVCVFSGLSDAQRSQLQIRGVPVVALDPSALPGATTPWVGAGNWTGGQLATRHLLALGHRRIAAITGPSRVLSSRARLDGFRAALDDAGIRADPELIREGDFHVEDGEEHGRRLLALPDPPTAIVTGNDLQALGVYQAAAKASLRIPRDLSVVGFDDLPLTRWASPPLTTVRQPLADMAAAAVGMALALARDEPLEQERLEFATRLVVRGSTAEPTAM
jgi:DNA-binding LacI/PurR family transcriptional regulator